MPLVHNTVTYRCDDTRGCVMQFWTPDDEHICSKHVETWGRLVHQTATYRCDDTRGCVMQFWPPDDEHICSKHVETWGRLVHKTATYKCDDTRGCVMQFWPPDDEHICSKHVEAWNKLIVKQTFCALSWLITEINILRCTASKTLKLVIVLSGLTRLTRQKVTECRKLHAKVL